MVPALFISQFIMNLSQHDKKVLIFRKQWNIITKKKKDIIKRKGEYYETEKNRKLAESNYDYTWNYGNCIFSGLTWRAFELRAYDERNPLWMWIFFSWYIAVLCYLILFEFWRICTQIGKNNSFSEENARYFHHMGLYGIGGIIGFAGRLLWLAAIGRVDVLNVGFRLARFCLQEFLSYCVRHSRGWYGMHMI